jgi:hypothetical protein
VHRVAGSCSSAAVTGRAGIEIPVVLADVAKVYVVCLVVFAWFTNTRQNHAITLEPEEELGRGIADSCVPLGRNNSSRPPVRSAGPSKLTASATSQLGTLPTVRTRRRIVSAKLRTKMGTNTFGALISLVVLHAN